jgi:hypothetical protein
MLQLKDKAKGHGLVHEAVGLCFSAFKNIDKYSEASLWGKLVTAL